MERRLHIGGKIPHADWEILNILDGENADHVSDAETLPQFADNTFKKVTHLTCAIDSPGAQAPLSYLAGFTS